MKLEQDSDPVEDLAKAISIVVIGVVTYHVICAAWPSLFNVAAKYRGASQKADQGNHQFLGRVDVVEVKSHSRQPSECNDYRPHENGGVKTSSGSVRLEQRKPLFDKLLPLHLCKWVCSLNFTGLRASCRRNVFVHVRSLKCYGVGEHHDIRWSNVDPIAVHIIDTTRGAL